MGHGVHDQPGVAVRAHFCHRHSGRRRHCGGGKHSSPRHARPHAFAAGDAGGGGRGGRAHHSGHLYRYCRAAAHGVCHRADGPLHAAHSRQRLGRHAAVAGGCAGGLAVAYAQSGASPVRSGADGRVRRPAVALQPLFSRLMLTFLHVKRAARRRLLLFAVMGLLVIVAAALVPLNAVMLNMLPFDNKSEFQVVVDMPEGSTVEATNRVLGDLAQVLDRVPEVDNYQAYAGTAAPITFNGLVRQYYLRSGPLAGDLQVNLVDKSERRRKSHDIARAVRPELAAVGKRYGAAVKVVEVPPGPPVLSPIVAEIYGPDESGVRALPLNLEKAFGNNPDIVDLDSSVAAPSPREVMVVDRARAARLGLNQADIARTLAMAHAGADPTYAMDGQSRYAVPIRVRLPAGDQARSEEHTSEFQSRGHLVCGHLLEKSK